MSGYSQDTESATPQLRVVIEHGPECEKLSGDYVDCDHYSDDHTHGCPSCDWTCGNHGKRREDCPAVLR